jgi:hypothetical protein
MSTIINEVTIDLNGSPKFLRVCPRAAKEITAQFGNYMEVFQRLVNFDHAAYVAIVASGLNKKRLDVEEDVWATGLDKLTDKLSEYVGLLLRAGRPAETDDDKKDPKTGEV